MHNEFLEILQQEPAFPPLFITGILKGIAQGQEPFNASHSDSCTGAMLIAPIKPNGLPRPVQNPDMCRAIATSLVVGKVLSQRKHSTLWKLGRDAQIFALHSGASHVMDALIS